MEVVDAVVAVLVDVVVVVGDDDVVVVVLEEAEFFHKRGDGTEAAGKPEPTTREATGIAEFCRFPWTVQGRNCVMLPRLVQLPLPIGTSVHAPLTCWLNFLNCVFGMVTHEVQPLGKGTSANPWIG